MITWLAASHYVNLIIFLFSERGTSKWCKAPPDVMHPLMITWLAASHYVTLISFLFSERGTSKWCKAPPDVMHPLMITWLAASHYVTLISFLFSERGTSKWCTHYWLRFVYMSGSGGVRSWIQWNFKNIRRVVISVDVGSGGGLGWWNFNNIDVSSFV